jgi:flagellar protein FliO/FliZ
MELIGGMSDAVKFFLVFVLITGILVPVAWRWFSIGPLKSAGPRGRQPRLAVIDTASVDVRRRLVLIKRDNVEHLLLIGGPTDIVVEANIARTGTVAREPRPIPDVARSDATRPTAAAEAPDWSLPLEPMGRPVRTVDLDAALPEPPARTAREAMVDSMRAVRSGAAARRNPPADLDTPLPPEEIAAPALTPASPMEINHRPAPIPEPRRAPPSPEPQRPQPAQEPPPPSVDAPEPKRSAAPAPPRPVPPLQPAPPPPPPRPVQPAAANGGAAPAPRQAQSTPAAAAAPSAPPPRQAQSDENSLAEMAQRLEAALRRPTKPAEAPSARLQGRPEPAAVRKPVNADAAGPAKPAAKPADSPPPELKIMPGKGKSEPAMESLEDEMAKMLGRSPGKS